MSQLFYPFVILLLTGLCFSLARLSRNNIDSIDPTAASPFGFDTATLLVALAVLLLFVTLSLFAGRSRRF